MRRAGTTLTENLPWSLRQQGSSFGSCCAAQVRRLPAALHSSGRGILPGDAFQPQHSQPRRACGACGHCAGEALGAAAAEQSAECMHSTLPNVCNRGHRIAFSIQILLLIAIHTSLAGCFSSSLVSVLSAMPAIPALPLSKSAAIRAKS